MKKRFLIFSLLIIFGCLPPAFEGPKIEDTLYADFDDCDPCPLILNFASSNYQNQDWRGAVDNYNQFLKCNCGNYDPENTFKYMGYSYSMLSLYDSAAYIYKKGLKFTPNDIDLLRMAGENAGRLQNFEDQIYFFDKILSIEENNLKVLEALSNVYRDQGMYEEQIDILDIWLKYDPASKIANGEKKAAFNALGKDESDVDKERWESDTSNIQYGLDYIKSLLDAGDFERIIAVCNELMVYDKYNTKILRNLGDAYLNVFKEQEALNIYKDLSKVDPTNYEVIIDITKILINKENYIEALNWSEKAVSISGKEGEALYQRAEVYYEIAASCNSDEKEISHWTRAVYEFAWQDYKNALNFGYKQAKSRKKWLEEQKLITQIGTWFQLEPQTQIILNESPNNCYSWIDRKLIKRKL